jgi:two-component system sensor histidine kinase RegB
MASLLQLTGSTLVNRDQINLFWLIRLRWAAVVGQLLTVLGTRHVLGIEIPLTPLIGIIGLVALSNLGCVGWFRFATRRDPQFLRGQMGEIVLGSVLVFDLILLTALLYFSGGPANPFSVFYIVGISLSAAVLSARWAWALTILAIVCFSFLFARHVPVEALGHHGPTTMHDHAHMHQGSQSDEEPMDLHLRGMLVAFAGAAIFVAYFVTRIRSELDLRNIQLAESERRKSNAEKLDSLVTMAAGAAHELASPLAAIAVAARELELRDPVALGTADAREDIVAIGHEVERCRGILATLTTQAGESMGEAPSSCLVKELIESCRASVPNPFLVQVSMPAELRTAVLRVPRQAVAQSLRSVVKNALEATPQGAEVGISVRRTSSGLEIVVADRGPGIPASIQERVGEPFLTTKPPGCGLGLGLFVTRRVMEQLGGTTTVHSEVGRGTTVTLFFPATSFVNGRHE